MSGVCRLVRGSHLCFKPLIQKAVVSSGGVVYVKKVIHVSFFHVWVVCVVLFVALIYASNHWLKKPSCLLVSVMTHVSSHSWLTCLLIRDSCVFSFVSHVSSHSWLICLWSTSWRTCLLIPISFVTHFSLHSWLIYLWSIPWLKCLLIRDSYVSSSWVFSFVTHSWFMSLLIRDSYICGLYRDSRVFSFVTHVSLMTPVSSHSWLVCLWCLWFLFVPHASSHLLLMSPSWLICDSFVTHVTLAGPVFLVTMSLGGAFVALFCIIVTRSWLVRDSCNSSRAGVSGDHVVGRPVCRAVLRGLCFLRDLFVTRSWLVRDSYKSRRARVFGDHVVGGPVCRAVLCGLCVGGLEGRQHLQLCLRLRFLSLSCSRAHIHTLSLHHSLALSPSLSHPLSFPRFYASGDCKAANIYNIML